MNHVNLVVMSDILFLRYLREEIVYKLKQQGYYDVSRPPNPAVFL